MANEWGREDKENECGNQEMQGSRRRKEKGVATRALKREDEERERRGEERRRKGRLVQFTYSNCDTKLDVLSCSKTSEIGPSVGTLACFRCVISRRQNMF